MEHPLSAAGTPSPSRAAGSASASPLPSRTPSHHALGVAAPGGGGWSGARGATKVTPLSTKGPGNHDDGDDMEDDAAVPCGLPPVKGRAGAQSGDSPGVKENNTGALAATAAAIGVAPAPLLPPLGADVGSPAPVPRPSASPSGSSPDFAGPGGKVAPSGVSAGDAGAGSGSWAAPSVDPAVPFPALTPAEQLAAAGASAAHPVVVAIDNDECIGSWGA
jgi:hypothetical protein